MPPDAPARLPWRGLARYLAGASAARAGDEMSGPALLLLGIAVTGAPAAGSALLASLTIAAALFGPLLGALLDRSPRPDRLLAAALAAYALGFAALGATTGHVPLGYAIAVALAAGVFGPAVAGGWTSRLPGVVAAPDLPRASALDALTYSAASLAGPGLAAATAAWLGARTAVLAAAALTALAVPPALSLSRTPAPAPAPAPPTRPPAPAHPAVPASAAVPPAVGPASLAEPPAAPAPAAVAPPAAVPRAASPPAAATAATAGTDAPRLADPPPAEAARPGPPPPPVPLYRQIAAGFAVIARRPRLLRVTAVSAIAYIGIGMLIVSLPVIGQERLGGAARGALLISVMAAASLAANAILARRPWPGAPDTVVLISTIVLGAAMIAVAIAPGWLTALPAVLAGAAEGPQLTSVFAVRHRETPAAMRAQVFTTAASVKITGLAAGAALGGALAGRSVITCLLAAATAEAAAAATYLLLSRRPRTP